jgi:hypothetical protein
LRFGLIEVSVWSRIDRIDTLIRRYDSADGVVPGVAAY